MYSRKGFTLTEVLIAIVLMGLVILAVTSVDITSRRFFGTSSKESWIQDEAKIAAEHMVKNIQLGVGDMSNPSTPVGSPPLADDSRGFLILDSAGNLVASGLPGGSQIQVKQDRDNDGTVDRTIEYNYDSGNYKIVYDEDVADPTNPTEDFAEGIVESAIFSFDSNTPNQVDVIITVRRDPTQEKSLDNPETTLTSSIVLRAMSCK